MSVQPSEKRDFLRIPFETDVEVRWSGGLIKPKSGLNISMSGLGFSTDHRLPALGSACNVNIILTAADTRLVIAAGGNVVRLHQGTVGIEFSELDLDSYHHLRKLIVNNAEDPDRAEQEFEAHWGIRKPGQ
jgi:PilZ domain-containing protein